MERLTKNEDGRYHYPKCFEECNGIGINQRCEVCRLDSDVCKKLGQYEDLEEQGKMLKLVCKVGDKIYYPGDAAMKKPVVSEIYKIEIDSDGIVYIDDYYEVYKEKDFGVKVFLNEEDARKKMEEDKNKDSTLKFSEELLDKVWNEILNEGNE